MDKEQLKERFEEAKKEHTMLDTEEAENACQFVSKLLQLLSEHIEEEEPYATRSIKELNDAEHKAYHAIDDLMEYIEQ